MIVSHVDHLNGSLSKKEQNIRQNTYIFDELVDLYHSFDHYPGQEYQELQDAIAAVLDKIYQHDHPYAYTNKLVMFIEARHALRGLYLSPNQNKVIRQLGEMCKRTNLNYVYLSAIDDHKQFL